jgi:hypothetical protein
MAVRISHEKPFDQIGGLKHERELEQKVVKTRRVLSGVKSRGAEELSYNRRDA